MYGTAFIAWPLFIAALAIFCVRAAPVLMPLRTGPQPSRFDQPRKRLAGVAKAIGLHDRLLKLHYSGALHLMIFSAFFVLLTSIIESFGSALFPGFSLDSVGGKTWIAALQDLFAIVMLAGVTLAAWQRYVLKPLRFRGSNTTDATIIYVLILIIVVSMTAEAAFRMIARGSQEWRPVAIIIAQALKSGGLSPNLAETLQTASYWLHIMAVLGFLVYIPTSKHRHMFLAAPNIYFRSLEPNGKLPAVQPVQQARTITIDDLGWKDKLDLLSCTECGRCQSVCPAYSEGLPLSPKMLIMDLRDHMLSSAHGPLAGNVISEETLWACTTCRACMEVCPLHIEHVPKIVALRRNLVDESRLAPTLQDAFSNLQRTGNSFGQSARLRARWTRDLQFRVKDARKETVDVLWFIGDFASFDERAAQVTEKIAKLLHAANVDFGILYEAEQNSGNDVRRAGEEGLFETLAQSNIETLATCTFNRILTSDPHTFNALRNEYPALGGVYQVVHHTEFFLELIENGALQIEKSKRSDVTYHDPCYLGRYNNIFEPARRLIDVAGYNLIEMPRNRSNSFCCGAGGGRIWGSDTASGERPSENRLKEAMALGDLRYFIVACPKDKVMYSAAASGLGLAKAPRVVDIVELLNPFPRVELGGSSEREDLDNTPANELNEE